MDKGGFAKAEFAVAGSFLGDSSELGGGGCHRRSQVLPARLVDMPAVRPPTVIASRHVQSRLFCDLIHDHVKAWDQFKRDEPVQADGAPSADAADDALREEPVRERRLRPVNSRNMESRSRYSVIVQRCRRPIGLSLRGRDHPDRSTEQPRAIWSTRSPA